MIRKTQRAQNGQVLAERYGVFTDDGELMSGATFITRPSRFGKEWVSTLAIGGVETEPEYRRGGNVRKMLDMAFEMAPERGWAVSLLHPFSFSYYRKFGYEKVGDHLIVEFPMQALEFVPRSEGWQRMRTDRQAKDALELFERFAANRNLTFRRFDASQFALPGRDDGKMTYLLYNAEGKAAAYVTLKVDKVVVVNHYETIALQVYETVYESREALRSLLGFLRMFEGEQDRIKLHNIAMCPELDMMLREYVCTGYTIVPDISARVLNVETMLKANVYPQQAGGFSLKVCDTLPYTRGVYRVDYDKGECEIQKQGDNAAWDVCVDAPALARLLYGYDGCTAQTAMYMPNVEAQGNAEDFFRAFPKRINGLFEHF